MIQGGCRQWLGIFVLAIAGVGSAPQTQAQLICAADPTRTIFVNGSGLQGGACRQFDGMESSCNQAFLLSGNDELASCYYDAGSDQCLGCGPNNEGDGDCTNTCRPTPVCTADPTRTFSGPAFGGQDGGACPAFNGNEMGCNQAFALGDDGPASCYYDSGNATCRGCGSSNEGSGNCTNTCRPTPVCAGAPTRTFAGPPFSGTQGGACRQYDNNAMACNQAFTLGNNGVASCFYDVAGERCEGCGPSNQRDGECTNVCSVAPGCAQDPGLTLFAGGPGTAACHQFDDNPASCNLAYHQGGNGLVASCFPTIECEPCGRGGEGATAPAGGGAAAGGGAGIPSDGDPTDFCINTCVPAPPCTLDPTRTFVGGPNTSACRQFDGDPTGCAGAYAASSNGAVSCFYDAEEETCEGCGPNNAGDQCTNSCVPPPACVGAPGRTVLVTGSGLSGQSCQQFDGDQTSCDQAFHISRGQPASCYFSNDSCNGCGLNQENQGNCVNACRPTPTCASVPARSFAGGPGTSQCGQFESNQSACELAFAVDNNGDITSCHFDSGDGSCRECSAEPEGDGLCQNTCVPPPPCLDASRTVFVGRPGSNGCNRFDNDQPGCAQAYVEDQDFGATPCWYDEDEDDCRTCDPEDVNEGRCTNTCQNIICSNQPSRTTFGECDDFDGDAATCAQAFQLDGDGRPVSCLTIPVCNGCGLENQADGACSNTCFEGPDDPDRPTTETALCDDGTDDDGDMLIDCADPDCVSAPNCIDPAPAPALSPLGLAGGLFLLGALAAYQLNRRSRRRTM